MALTREDMDEMTAGGCQMPGCTHEHHAGEPLVMMSACHPKTGCHLKLIDRPDPLLPFAVALDCGTCGRYVTTLLTRTDISDWKQDCHPTSPCEVSYGAGSGYAVVTCKTCENVIGLLDMENRDVAVAAYNAWKEIEKANAPGNLGTNASPHAPKPTNARQSGQQGRAGKGFPH